MVNQEVIFSIALSKLKGLSLLNARVLVDAMGAASEVFAHRSIDDGRLAEQGQRIGDIARRAAAFFFHMVYGEADVEEVEFFRKDMVFEAAGEGHDAVEGERT